ncbi:hypothetical protein BRC62_04710 [Halobacteriales archaeon QH_10_67_13]|nr:MAG: hypothetical protein BRC62_04710 [Halobacteriales archaeon QH_10_67_13]
MERCQQYQAFLEYTGEHPNTGRVQVANNMLDGEQAPPSRVRPWLDGGMPDPVRAIQTAEERGWLGWDAASPSTRALNCLVAWIFAGGSITRQYALLLTVGDETQPCATTLLERRRASRRRSPSATPPTAAGHARPNSDPGPKLLRWGGSSLHSARRRVRNTPTGLVYDYRPISTPRRESCARTYVWLREAVRDDLPERRVQISSDRPAAFRRGMHRLLEELVVDAVRGEPGI